MRNSPRERAVVIRSSDVATSSVNGFSQSTALPAERQTIVAAWCDECGVAT
jgi:hypothetical protein